MRAPASCRGFTLVEVMIVVVVLGVLSSAGGVAYGVVQHRSLVAAVKASAFNVDHASIGEGVAQSRGVSSSDVVAVLDADWGPAQSRASGRVREWSLSGDLAVIFDESQTEQGFVFSKSGVVVCYNPALDPRVGSSPLRVVEEACPTDPVFPPSAVTVEPQASGLVVSWQAAVGVVDEYVASAMSAGEVLGQCSTPSTSCALVGLLDGVEYSVVVQAVRENALETVVSAESAGVVGVPGEPGTGEAGSGEPEGSGGGGSGDDSAGGGDPTASPSPSPVSPSSPPEAVVLRRDGVVSSTAYRVKWTPSSTAVGYRVFELYNPSGSAPTTYASEVFADVSPSNSRWHLVADVSQEFYDAEMGYPVPGQTGGVWRRYQVVPYNAAGEGPASNQVTVADGHRSGQGSWLACGVESTGKVRIVGQVPDSWGLVGPFTYEVRSHQGNVVASGSTVGGLFPVDVPSGTVLGKLWVTDQGGSTMVLGGQGTGSANYHALVNTGHQC